MLQSRCQVHFLERRCWPQGFKTLAASGSLKHLTIAGMSVRRSIQCSELLVYVLPQNNRLHLTTTDQTRQANGEGLRFAFTKTPYQFKALSASEKCLRVDGARSYVHPQIDTSP